MRKILLWFLLLNVCNMFSQNTLLYLHGAYTDSDWEQMEFVLGEDGKKGEFYYNYAQSKKGRIKLEKKEKLEIGGRIIWKVEFPVILKLYYLTFAEDMRSFVMKDEKGGYEKDFYLVSTNTKGNNVQSNDYQSKIKTAFTNYIQTNADYCTEAECNKAYEDSRNGREMRCSIGIENGSIDYIFGDINQDGQMDALVNFGLIQCDGGNALCGAGGQALVISGLSNYKVLETRFDDGDAIIRHDLQKINGDGTITSEDWYWADDDPRCMPSLSKKAKYKLEYTLLTKTY